MGCFENALGGCMPPMTPYDWMDPYGDMPLANGMEASVKIDVMLSDNGMRVTSVKTPPQDGRIRLPELLESIMGSQMGLQCAADQGKCKPEKDVEKPDDSGKMDDRKPPEHPDDAKPGDKPEESTAAPAGKDDKDSWRKEKK